MINHLPIVAFLYLVCAAFISPAFNFAQETVPADSSKSEAAPLDSSQTSQRTEAGDKKPDAIKPANIGIDSKVEYSARTIDSRKSDGIIYLIDDAQVKYKDITIKAGKITIKWKEDMVIAESIPDSTKPMPDDSSQFIRKGYPAFSDGKEGMTGEKMEYNFKSEKGRIVRGRTEFQKGYYFGDTVKRVDSEVFFVSQGSYSTCDKEEPHFHFRGPKMKVIANDKVIAKPVIFFLGKIPLAIFPFAMFPAQESGRQSGIILPQFGSSQTEGRYLRNMGYYWAASDYMDMQLTLDYFDRSGIFLRGKMNYALRYKFTGSVDGSFTRKNFQSGRRERRWSLAVRHNQTIDENTRLSVDASFVSNNSFYRELSENRSERLNRQIRSNATLSKNWGEGKNSLTVNLSQVKDVEDGSETLTLPQLNFSRSRSALLPFKEDKTGRSKKESKWYNEIYYTYSTSMRNIMRDDTTAMPPDDVRSANHRLSFSQTPKGKLFGVIGLSQNFNYQEDWFDSRRTDFMLIDSTNTFDSREENGFFRRYQYNYSLSASTNLYGTAYPGFFGVKAVRHKMSPSVSFSFRPDFTDKYFVTKTDRDSVERNLDRFQGSPLGKSMSMSYRLSNLFQMKVGKSDKERVLKLFDLNFSGSYNFAADSLKLSNLATNFIANPAKSLTVTANMNHSFYRFNLVSNRTVNEFIAPRLTSFRLDASWSLSGKKSTPATTQAQADKEPVEISQLGRTGPSASGEYEDRFAPESAFSALEIPWRANLSLSYSINKANPNFKSKSAYIDLRNVELQITKNWRIGYLLRYDLQETRVVDQRLSFYRDLHCWEARFDWTPSGFGKGYYFIINVKAPHLRQLKVERRGGSSSIFN